MTQSPGPRTMSPARPAKAAMTPKQLRAVLKRNRFTQVEAAQRLGVNARTFRRWVSGETPISEANALLITARIGR